MTAYHKKWIWQNSRPVLSCALRSDTVSPRFVQIYPFSFSQRESLDTFFTHLLWIVSSTFSAIPMHWPDTLSLNNFFSLLRCFHNNYGSSRTSFFLSNSILRSFLRHFTCISNIKVVFSQGLHCYFFLHHIHSKLPNLQLCYLQLWCLGKNFCSSLKASNQMRPPRRRTTIILETLRWVHN